MSKKEFLEKLEHKLHLLKQDEIQDILDEYSGYIDNKLQEGKTEDEAVADFGNRIRLMINIPMIKAAILSTMSLTS